MWELVYFHVTFLALFKPNLSSSLLKKVKKKKYVVFVDVDMYPSSHMVLPFLVFLICLTIDL
jgi:hypothetical protein